MNVNKLIVSAQNTAEALGMDCVILTYRDLKILDEFDKRDMAKTYLGRFLAFEAETFKHFVAGYITEEQSKFVHVTVKDFYRNYNRWKKSIE